MNITENRNSKKNLNKHESDKLLEPFESVSNTALLTSYSRSFSDIPYEKEIYDWLSKNCNGEFKFNKLRAPEMEARYKLIDQLIKKVDIPQILELASGYSSRGLIFSSEGYKYVEMDLETVASNKKRLINELFKPNDNLKVVSGNALNYDDYIKCDSYLNDNEIIIVNEGLLRYLTFDEKRRVGENIYQLLKKHGGVWITSDVTPKRFIQEQEKLTPKSNNDINNINSRKNLNDRFEDENHIRTFLKEIGFNNIELHQFIEVKDELKSFDALDIDKDLCDSLLESAIVAIIRI